MRGYEHELVTQTQNSTVREVVFSPDKLGVGKPGGCSSAGRGARPRFTEAWGLSQGWTPWANYPSNGGERGTEAGRPDLVRQEAEDWGAHSAPPHALYLLPASGLGLPAACLCCTTRASTLHLLKPFPSNQQPTNQPFPSNLSLSVLARPILSMRLHLPPRCCRKWVP